jgi:hypothetical protein
MKSVRNDSGASDSLTASSLAVAPRRSGPRDPSRNVGRADVTEPLRRGRHAKDSSPTLRTGLVLSTVVVCLVVWFLRRPDQFLHPYVWDEEFQILNRYQAQGFLHAALTPVEGYFVWPTSFTIAAAAATSFLHVPFIDYWVGTAWFTATICLILVPRSSIQLPWRMGFAVLLVLVPINPEVFGVTLYVFWWTSLWPVISLLWSKDYWFVRIPVLVIGGMSSLAGAAMVVPYALLFALTRQRRYLVGTAVLGVTLVVQSAAYFSSARSAGTSFRLAPVSIQELRNFSYYEFRWLNPTNSHFLAIGGACLLVAVVGVVMYGAAKDRTPQTHLSIALLVGLLVVGVLSAVPYPLGTDPILAGPRYYFLPYVVLGWLLLMIAASTTHLSVRIAAVVLIAVSLISLVALPWAFTRHDDQVSWSHQLAARCERATKPFTVPVQRDGSRADLWRRLLVITPQTCQSLGYR